MTIPNWCEYLIVVGLIEIPALIGNKIGYEYNEVLSYVVFYIFLLTKPMRIYKIIV